MTADLGALEDDTLDILTLRNGSRLRFCFKWAVQKWAVKVVGRRCDSKIGF